MEEIQNGDLTHMKSLEGLEDLKIETKGDFSKVLSLFPALLRSYNHIHVHLMIFGFILASLGENVPKKWHVC